MTYDRSARPLGKRTDVDLLEEVVLPVKWSWIIVIWLGWPSWEPWRLIYGADLQKTTKKTREEEERIEKKACGGKNERSCGYL